MHKTYLKVETSDEEYTCKTFSLALPEGSNRADLPQLLENFAREVRNAEMNQILDLTFQSEIDDDAQEVISLTILLQVKSIFR